MLYSQRAVYQYDTKFNMLEDVAVALRIHDEYIRSFCGYLPGPVPNQRVPATQFMEVDRSPGKIDPVWHMPTTPYTPFCRTLNIPAINQHGRGVLTNTKMGQVYQKKDSFWVSNLGLQAADYFPTPGDQVWYNGYRYEIFNVVIPPESIWGQTNVWLGLVCETVLVPYGDAQMAASKNMGVLLPTEMSTAQPPTVSTQAF